MEMTRRQAVSAALIAGAGWVGTGAGAQTRGPLKVQFALFDGFELTDALAPFDALKVSEKLGSSFQTSLVTLCGELEVVALDGVAVKPTAAFDWDADALVIPGAPQLWRQGVQPAGLDAVLHRWRSAQKLLATVCTGGVLAARAGVLKGRNATTHHAGFEALKAQGVNLIAARVVDDGDVLSAGGVTSGIDLALHLIERFYGPQLAIETERVFEYERRGTVWRAA